MKLSHVIGLFGVSAIGILVAADLAGLGINVTHSAPIGLWTAQPFDPSSLRRGMTVLVCPPDQPVVREMRDRGYLPPGDCPHTHVMQLGKTIRAIPGDVVQIKAGMPATVNGFPLPNSIARPSVPAWPQGEYAVQPGEVWIFSSYSADSFDSRYFGPVNPSAIRGETAPLLVYGDRETM